VRRHHHSRLPYTAIITPFLYQYCANSLTSADFGLFVCILNIDVDL
jgi:hypothetical protein